MITLAEAGAICSASMAATIAALLALHRGERLDGWAIWTGTAAAALAAGALLATLAAEIGAALAR
jgi:hypothetical protein